MTMRFKLRRGNIFKAVDNIGSEGEGKVMKKEGGGEEEEGEEKQEASGGVGFVVGIWIWGRRRIERDHARVQLGTVGWNVGRGRR